MTFGTIYTHNPNPRTTAILVVAKAHGLDLKVVYADRDDGENYEALLKVNPLGQVPTLVTASDGWVLTECIPITLYIASQSDTTNLLGSSRRDYYEILKWMSFANGDFMPAIGGCILPLIGRPVAIRKDAHDCLRAIYRHCRLTDDHLASKVTKNQAEDGEYDAYLVGDGLTLADLFVASLLFGLFKVFHPVVHVRYPALTRWFYGVCGLPMVLDVAGKFEVAHLDYPKLPEDEDEDIGERQGKVKAGGESLEVGKTNGIAAASP
ncbi:glutathione S-transferase [Xylaria longipes]|nr:glutathione S-transferase [Xylaria longipes]RYC56976.1 hypothetical protein CHU98_g9233 [Xylaria longipes]